MMPRLFQGFLVGWLATTSVYAFGLFVETQTLSPSFVMLAAQFIAAYALIVSIPLIVIFRRLRLKSLRSFVLLGLIGATPMLVYCLLQREFMYTLLTVVAGAIYGGAFWFFCRDHSESIAAQQGVPADVARPAGERRG
jgi:hypothetical protein